MADVDGVSEATDLQPLCDEERFAELVQRMVAYSAPRLFALVEEYGERADGRVAAWGMAFEDRVYAISADGTERFSMQSVDDVVYLFSLGAKIRLVWATPSAATSRGSRC